MKVHTPFEPRDGDVTPLMPAKRALLVHQSVRPPGGANAVAAWAIQALRDDFSLTILTWNPIDSDALNRFYGTSIRQSDFEIIRPSAFIRSLRYADPDPQSVQPAAYMMRFCRKIRNQYDVVVATGSEEFDLGGPALLYIHHPDLGRFWGKYQDSGEKPLMRNLTNLLKGRTRLWILLSGFSLERLKRHTILTNSDWTGSKVEHVYGIATQTVYPPVAASNGLPWCEREQGFVASGRFDPKKRWDRVIRILGRVRREGAPVSLHLVGTPEPYGDGPGFYRVLRKMADENSEWVTLHENLSRDRLSELTGQLRYGIHAQIDEHFGLAPAEALMAGCIPFVHASGGQIEIPARDPRLCFVDDDDAVRKITAVVKDTDLQQELLGRLERQKELFTSARFMENFRCAALKCAAESQSGLDHVTI